MGNMITSVFKILGMLMLSALLFTLIFGAEGRTFMWGAIEPAMQRQWSMVTLRDGGTSAEVTRRVFDETEEYKKR